MALVSKTRLPLEELFDWSSIRTLWGQIKYGTTIMVALGSHDVQILESSKTMRAVGSRDLRAVALLFEHLYRRLNLQCAIEIFPVSQKSIEMDWEDQFETIAQRKDVSGIVCLGSVTNPMSDIMARRIWGADKPPATFRYTRLQEASFLCQPCKHPEEEGIRYGKDLLPRTRSSRSDDERSIVKDCGLIGIRAKPNEPLLVLCAGHGGAGTIAAVLGVSNESEIKNRLQANPDKFFELVWVKRDPHAAHSDLPFDQRKGKGWDFHFGPAAEADDAFE